MRHNQFEHQETDLTRSWAEVGWAWFWEMGLGKSKQMIDTWCRLLAENLADAMLVVAPNGVHHNMCGQELPEHCDVDHAAFTWRVERAKTKKHADAWEKFLADERPRALSMSYDALCTKAGYAAAELYLKKSRVLMVLDESSMIKAPRSDRSKACHKLAPLAKYRRIADGTPVAEGPFDIFSQLAFVIPDYWRQHGMANFFSFKNQFGRFRTATGQGRQYQELVCYQNVDFLQRLISNISTRYLKQDCLDLPEKMYARLTFDLVPEQQKLYDQLRGQLRAELESGAQMEASTAIVRLLRLQQIASGYGIATERPDVGGQEPPRTPEEAMERLRALMDQDVRTIQFDVVPPDKNPRLQLLLAHLGTVRGKVIINVRFTRDVELITEALGEQCLRYDGQTSAKDREHAIAAFRDPAGPPYLCVNIAALSRGVTLVIAKNVIYYTNSFNLIQRLQSEDRAHRIGQTEKVQYVDIVANDTVDEHIVKTLREKFDLAASITGDTLREWIQ